MITGRNMTRVITMAMKVFKSEASNMRKEITKAATAKAIPTA